MADVTAREGSSQKFTELAALTIAMQSSVGPLGSAKLVMTRDGAVELAQSGLLVLRRWPMKEPVTRLVRDACVRHHSQYGDGVKRIVLLADALLRQAQRLGSRGVPVAVIARMWSDAMLPRVRDALDGAAVALDTCDGAAMQAVARAAFCGRGLGANIDALAALCVHASSQLPPGAQQAVQVVCVDGSSSSAEQQSSECMDGFVFERPFALPVTSRAKRVEAPRVLLLNVELEHKHLREYTVSVTSATPRDGGSPGALEQQISVRRCGATIVLSAQSGDAVREFARVGIVALGRLGAGCIDRAQRCLCVPVLRV